MVGKETTVCANVRCDLQRATLELTAAGLGTFETEMSVALFTLWESGSFFYEM